MNRLSNLGGTLRWCLDRIVESGAEVVRGPSFFVPEYCNGRIEFSRKDILNRIVCDEGSTRGTKHVGRFQVKAFTPSRRRPHYFDRVDVDRVIRLLNCCHDLAELANYMLAYEFSAGKYQYIYIACYSAAREEFDAIPAITHWVSTTDRGAQVTQTYSKSAGGVEYHCYLSEDVKVDEEAEGEVQHRPHGQTV